MMEYEHAGVIFLAERSLLGVTIVVKELAAPREITRISQLKFSSRDIEAIAEHFNANLPAELAFPDGRPIYQVNLVIITEAMVGNAIEKFDSRAARN
jgi:hypothetical protein